MTHGGKRLGAGRKPKSTELELVELLSSLDDEAYKALEKGVKSGNVAFLKLFMEYRHGKPKQPVEIRQITEIEEIMLMTPEERIQKIRELKKLLGNG